MKKSQWNEWNLLNVYPMTYKRIAISVNDKNKKPPEPSANNELVDTMPMSIWIDF